MSYNGEKFYKISSVIFVGLLFALVLVTACTNTSEPPASPAPAQTSAVPVTSGASVTTKIPATTITAGKPSCPSGQTLCDGSCIDTQSNSQHCGACGHVCNTSEPCSEGTCLSWTGTWWSEFGWYYTLTQTGTFVNGTDTYGQMIISGSISGNPPRLICTWSKGKLSSPCTYDMAPDGKSFTGSLLGCNVLTYTRQQD